MDTLSIFLIIFALIYLMFVREINNTLIKTFRNKDYVVVHIRKSANRKPLTYNIIPNIKHNFMTKVPQFLSKRRYILRPDEANFVDEDNRKHYIFNEEDAMQMKFKPIEVNNEVVLRYKKKLYFCADGQGMPIKLDPRTSEDYVIGSKRMDAAMSAESYRVIHEEKNQLLFYIYIALFLVTLLAIIYGVMQYQKLSPLVETIYAQTVVQHGTTTIAPAPTITPHS